jgi:hypothetical protein
MLQESSDRMAVYRWKKFKQVLRKVAEWETDFQGCRLKDFSVTAA